MGRVYAVIFCFAYLVQAANAVAQEQLATDNAPPVVEALPPGQPIQAKQETAPTSQVPSQDQAPTSLGDSGTSSLEAMIALSQLLQSELLARGKGADVKDATVEATIWAGIIGAAGALLGALIGVGITEWNRTRKEAAETHSLVASIFVAIRYLSKILDSFDVEPDAPKKILWLRSISYCSGMLDIGPSNFGKLKGRILSDIVDLAIFLTVVHSEAMAFQVEFNTAGYGFLVKDHKYELLMQRAADARIRISAVSERLTREFQLPSIEIAPVHFPPLAGSNAGEQSLAQLADTLDEISRELRRSGLYTRFAR